MSTPFPVYAFTLKYLTQPITFGNEMLGGHHQLNGHESDQTPGT